MLNAARWSQIGVGAVGAFAAYHLGSNLIAATRNQDLTGAPTRVVSVNGRWIVEQENTPLTGILTMGMMGVGAIAAGIGAVLVFGHAPTLASAGVARTLGGVALLGGGAGLIGGAIGAADRTSNSVVRPNRSAPQDDGIAITTPDTSTATPASTATPTP
jgi:hypothetical protein